jgi:hypothetical protein
MYTFLAELPQAFYTPPPGPMFLFDSFPPAQVFWLLHGMLILSLLAMLVGFKTTVSSFAAGLLLLIIKGFFYSTGKINHDLLLAIVPMVMAFTGWGAAYSLDARRLMPGGNSIKVASWPLTLLALFIGFMMFTAGFAKVLGGWLSTGTQATLGHFFIQFFTNGRQDLLAPILITVDYRFFWEMIDYATVVFEVGFLLAILHPKSTKIFISCAVVFHFSIMMSLNISFLPNFPAYAAFLHWTAVDAKVNHWAGRTISPAVIFVGLPLLLVIALFGGQIPLPLLQSDLQITEFYVVLLALPIAVTYLSLQAYHLLRSGSNKSRQAVKSR